LSQAIPTDILEHALLHARQETSRCERCERCDREGEIGVAELQLAMEARLMNARALIHAVRDPNKQTALMRSMATVDHLIHEAIELSMLVHWMNGDFRCLPTQNDEAMDGT
jgi:hypothetical protein